MILNIGLGCQIDLNRYVEEGLRVFITGQSGSGKSYLAKVILEELADLKMPIIIIDPEGEYTAFKERYSSLIVGGASGDLSYDEFNLDLALKTVEAVYNQDYQILIFDTSELFSSEQIKTHSQILEAVFKTAGLKKTPCVFVVEEAHIIAPQTGGSGRSLDLSMEIAKRGRKRGLHSIWVTQRPADISKKVISQCNIRFFGRHQEPADLNALRAYIRNLGLEETKLMSLNKEFIFYSKGEVKQVKARALRIKDLGATPKSVFAKKDGEDLKTVLDEAFRLFKVKPAPPVIELKEEEVSFNVLKKQLFLREKMAKLKEHKIEYKRILDGIISKIDSGELNIFQARVELQKLKTEIEEVLKLETELYTEYKRLPYEGVLQEKNIVERRLRILEQRRREGKVNGEAYLQLKEEYSRKLIELEEKSRLFKQFAARQLADLNRMSEVLRKELELLNAKREVGEYTEKLYKLKEKELKKTLEETVFCVNLLNRMLS